MKTIAFFNNKGGVGKTSLLYHLAHMFAQMDLNVVAADFDPQANLTSMFLDEDRLEEFWPDGDHPKSILGSISRIKKGTGDISPAYVEEVEERIGLIVGDLGLSEFEDKLSQNWPLCSSRDEAAFRVTSALFRVLKQASEERGANITLIDVGPNLGAINRAALIASDHIVMPLAPDLFSLQGLRNLGPTLNRWREEWTEKQGKNPAPDLALPSGRMKPAGYVVIQHAVRLDRPVKAYDRWMQRIPNVYRQSVLNESSDGAPTVHDDPYCLGQIKHFHSLMPLAQEARKPMFKLRAADGAIGAHQANVSDSHGVFSNLAKQILRHVE